VGERADDPAQSDEGDEASPAQAAASASGSESGPPTESSAAPGADGQPEGAGQEQAAEDEGAEVVDMVDLSLRDQIAALEARLRTVSAAYRQQQDEIASTKERLARQAAVKEELRRGEVVGTLFDPVENLRRATDSVRKTAGTDAVAGLDIVLHQFFEAFKKLGLEEVPGKGSRFDPNLHEAISAIPVADPALDGVVIEVFDTGYRIGSRLLKPSRVVIGQLQEGLGEA